MATSARTLWGVVNMRIDLPLCDLKTCRIQFDHNCTDKTKYEQCHYKNPWIPCSWMLPERGESVLLCDLDGDIYLGHLATGCNYYYADYCDDRIKNVVAWCELPEPFKEKN